MIIPSKHCGYGEGGRLTSTRRVFDSGGGGNQTQTSTTISDIPDWVKPTAQKALGAAEALAFKKDAQGNVIGPSEYQAYGGKRIADFQDLQNRAFTGVGNLQTAPGLDAAQGITGAASMGALGTRYNPYQTGQFGQQAGDYMSPFVQQSLNPQLRELTRQSEIQRMQNQAQAVGQGAFGGSRSAIVEAERQRNLGQAQQDVLDRGYQQAFDRAQQQFNTEQQLREQSRQYGAGLGMQGLQTALQGAGQLGTLGSQQFAQQKDILGLQSQYGSQQQQQEQAKLSQDYQDFLNQQKYPYQQLEFLSNIVRGTPMGTTSTLYSPTPSPLTQLAGAGTALYGASKLVKKGGAIKAPKGKAAGLAELAMTKI